MAVGSHRVGVAFLFRLAAAPQILTLEGEIGGQEPSADPQRFSEQAMVRPSVKNGAAFGTRLLSAAKWSLAVASRPQTGISRGLKRLIQVVITSRISLPAWRRVPMAARLPLPGSSTTSGTLQLPVRHSRQRDTPCSANTRKIYAVLNGDVCNGASSALHSAKQSATVNQPRANAGGRFNSDHFRRGRPQQVSAVPQVQEPTLASWRNSSSYQCHVSRRAPDTAI
jgi:hypothetical protein